MEFNFGILLIISFSSVLLTSPLALCLQAPAPSPIPVSYISEAPAYIPDAPTSYISDVPASAPSPSLSPDFSPAPISSSSPAPDTSNTVEFKVEKPSDEIDPVDYMEIKKICHATEHPVLCAKSILPYIKGAINPLSALQTEITTFLHLLDKALALLKAFDNDPSTSSSTSDCLKVCLDIYRSAQADLKQALDAIDTSDRALLKSMLSGAITDLGTCEDTFAESSGDELPLDNDLVSTLRMLATICMDIAAVLLI